jgi:hypothetical protein
MVRARLAAFALLAAVASACASGITPTRSPRAAAEVPPPFATRGAPPAAGVATKGVSSTSRRGDDGRGQAHAPDSARERAEERARVRAMLARVARARGLPPSHDIEIAVQGRDDLLAHIRAHVDRELPADVITCQGEVLTALELLPPGYDFLEGTYRLVGGRVAGFYEPADRTMYLADDLSDAEAEETLAHELVHALQDQRYDLATMLRYVPGEGDRLTAVHALIEGDATSAMLDVTIGSAFDISEAWFRRLLSASTALSPEGAATPPVLAASLTSPYADGFAFVQALRVKGGFPAVDEALRAPPATTEQLLHPDKFAAREPAVAVAELPLAALGPGFRAVIDDVNGEQGLRIMLEQWAPRARAEEAAAGWGGDRYVVARREDGEGKHAVAVGMRMVFDTPKDAGELAAVLTARFGASCRERPALGPLTFRWQGKEVALVAGPFARRAGSKATVSAGQCATVEAWAAALLTPAASAPTPPPAGRMAR